MAEASVRGNHCARRPAHVALIVLILSALLVAGCRQEARQSPAPAVIDGSHVELLAYLDGASPCQQGTIEMLRGLENKRPARLDVRIIDISTRRGWERWEESGLDSVALAIDGNTTVSWGEGDGRRTVTFKHPAGFTWTHEDLRAALEAALDESLVAADPAEAEGVRLMDVSVRGQSIRVGDNGSETGQLVIGEQIVIDIQKPRGDLAPGQRVTIAADTLKEVLQEPFTPNQLALKRIDAGMALMAGGRQLLVVTEADVSDEDTTVKLVAERWRRALREALISAALERPNAPDPSADLTDSLQPTD